MQAKKMNTPTITLEDIDPHKAAEMLRGNSVNRRMVPNHLNRLVSEMLADEWRVTGDTIKLNGDRLLDGQHRLEAVVRSGVTIRTWVARGVDSEAFPMIDTGRSRQGGDVLSAHGYHNVFLTASSARLIYHFEHKNARLEGAVTNNAILWVVKRHDQLPDFISDVCTAHFAKVSAVVAALFWLWLADPDRGEAFLQAFLKGIELKLTSPIYVLRERVINDRTLSSTKSGRKALVAMVFRTWDAWLGGRTQAHLKATLPGESDFPWPKGAPYL
jgi:hypothetical protein